MLVEYRATSSAITEDIRKRMEYSYQEDGPVPLEDLCYLTISHYDFDDKVATGEMVVHKSLAPEVMEIFKDLFDKRFPIEKMRLIDEYKADDDISMEENNSSAFCSRRMTGSTTKWSKHSYGVAIDINPKYNPYVIGSKVLPKGSESYVSRNQTGIKGFITGDGDCVSVFKKYGWTWGGEWTSLQDYHHFEKNIQ